MINRLSRSVKRRNEFDVNEVFTHLLMALFNWLRVRVVNELTATSGQHRESDDFLCAACSATLMEPHNETVEWRFHLTSIEQRFPLYNEAIEQRLPQTSTSVEQRLPINIEAVEKGSRKYTYRPSRDFRM